MSRIKLKKVDQISRKTVSDARDGFLRHCQLKNLAPHTYTYYKENVSGRNSLPSVRRPVEIAAIEKMTELLREGVALLETIADPNEELQRLLLLGKFLVCSSVTAIHAKRFYTLKARLAACESREESATLLDEIEQVMRAERANVEEAIPVVELDSRLGWEPSMEYQCDEKSLRWKLRQLEHELNISLWRIDETNKY